MRIAIVSTLVRAQPVLASWVAHHRALGIERFYLFADDPAEIEAYRRLELPGVQWFTRDEQLQGLWQSARDWDGHGRFMQVQVYARQCLNTNVAMARARDEGFDWLLHLDIDELLHVPEGCAPLPIYLASQSHRDLVTFVNHEALPEQWHITDYFQEVTLFKRNAWVLDAEQRRIVQSVFGARYFLAYGNGKSAVNLHGAALEADGVHLFRPARQTHIESTLCVLHYSTCGFNWFYEKFAVLGNFQDRLLDVADITESFPMLAKGRAAVVRGTVHDATRLYEQVVMRQGGLPDRLSSLLEAGILMRLPRETPQWIG